MQPVDLYEEVRVTKDYRKAIELIPYAQFLGISFQLDPEDGLLFSLPFKQENIGNFKLPALHGGVIGGLMETAAIVHLMWKMECLTLPKVIDFTIDYLRFGKPIETYATCSITKLGKRIANVYIEAWQEDRAQPIAIARSHFKLTQD